MNRKVNNKGFTIIEVVLVLAIAALIMLMVFVAWPALQRSQRDGARKNDVSAVVSAINTYATNHNGKMPASQSDLTAAISADNLSRIASVTYKASATSLDATQVANLDTIQVSASSTCNASTNQAQAGTSRQMAVVTVLETNGTKAVYCQNV